MQDYKILSLNGNVFFDIVVVVIIAKFALCSWNCYCNVGWCIRLGHRSVYIEVKRGK